MKIELDVPHNLSKQEALRRLSTIESDGNIQLLEQRYVPAAQTVELDIIAYGNRVTVSVVIWPDHVHLTVGEFPWYYAPALWIARSKIQEKIKNALAYCVSTRCGLKRFNAQMNPLILAARADADLTRLERAGIDSSQHLLSRLRIGLINAWRTKHLYSTKQELLNNMAPAMARAMAISYEMGRRRELMQQEMSLDHYSDIMKQLRAAGLGKELTKIQRGYARRVYDSLRDMGSNLDAKSRGAIATLIADGTPQAKAIKILDKLLDLPRAQLETIYRTEIQMAYQTGKWAQAQERWDDIWGFRYVTMHDDRVRPTHAALDGIILPKDSSFWQRYWPPNGWNCRCQVVTIYKTPGVKPKTRRPEGKLPLPDDGFRHNPGEFPFVEFSWDPDLHPRVDAGHQGGGQFTSKDSWPKSMSDLKHVSTLGGSTGAVLMEDEHGNKFVVKSGKKSGQAENEWIANQLYKALGVKVPDGIMLDGKHVMKYIDGKLLSELSGEELKQAEELLRKQFAADALLANWDVIGLNKDNIIVDKNGVPWRIDNGGSLSFRAQGGPKGTLWNGHLTELDTMREQGMAGKVFKGVKEADIKEQGQNILNKYSSGKLNDALVKLSEHDQGIMKQRLEALQMRVNATPSLPKVVKPVTTPLGSTPFMGTTLEGKIKNIQQNVKAKFNSVQLKKIALLNDGTNDTHLVIPKSFTPEQQQALKDAYPGKPVKLVVASKALAHHGVDQKVLWHTKPKKLEQILYKVTKEEKDIAVKLAKTAAEKHAANALETVEAKAAEYHQTNASPHWEGREKIQNGGTVKDVTHKGSYQGSDDYTNEIAEANLAKVTDKDRSAISTWKGGQQYAIRKTMWTGDVDNPAKADDVYVKKAKQFIDMTNEKRLPNYEGVLYRGVGHVIPGTKFYDAIQQVGNVVELEAHMGCSRRSAKSVSFSEGICLMRIAAKNGHNMEDVFGYKEEHEVLMPRGTKLRVVGVAHGVMGERIDKSKRKVALFVDLEEVHDEQPHHKISLSQATLWEIPQLDPR